MKFRITYLIVFVLLALGAYVLLVPGGKIKFGNLIEVESNKSQSPATSADDQKKPLGDAQNASVTGSGYAVNANNGASVHIGK